MTSPENLSGKRYSGFPLNPKVIEQDEDRGSAQLVASEVLPKSDTRTWEILKSMGIKLGKDVPGDPIFVYAELPEGWSKKRSEKDSRGSYIVDSEGRNRASIFYKAASYDRFASISPISRYSIQLDYDRCETENEAIYRIEDYTGVIHEMDPVKLPDKKTNGVLRIEERDKAQCIAITWMDENYPDWNNHIAYW